MRFGSLYFFRLDCIIWPYKKQTVCHSKHFAFNFHSYNSYYFWKVALEQNINRPVFLLSSDTYIYWHTSPGTHRWSCVCFLLLPTNNGKLFVEKVFCDVLGSITFSYSKQPWRLVTMSITSSSMVHHNLRGHATWPISLRITFSFS